MGYGAMVSFGHAAHLGFGVYAVAILNTHGLTEFALHIGFAVAISALFAGITGAISLRARGVYFIMITLDFGQMAYFFFVSLSGYGGDDGTPRRPGPPCSDRAPWRITARCPTWPSRC